MDITVTGRKMTVSDALHDYAVEKIGNAMKVTKIEPLSADVILHVERNRAIAAPCCCEVTLQAKGHIIRVEEKEEDMYAAIDVAAAKVLRQLRKYKTRVIDRRTRAGAQPDGTIRVPNKKNTELDVDALMDGLIEDDEIVRVKEIEFTPMTEEEALIQIDLLGHDFYAFIDRDTNVPCVLYRRDNGGYGLIKEKVS